MQLPGVPLFLLLSLLPSGALFVLGRWALAYAPARTSLSIISLALGSGIFFISLTSVAIHVLQPLQGGPVQKWVLAMSVIPYFGIIVAMAKNRAPIFSRLAILASLGLVPLYFMGTFSAILAVCSFGDCL